MSNNQNPPYGSGQPGYGQPGQGQPGQAQPGYGQQPGQPPYGGQPGYGQPPQQGRSGQPPHAQPPHAQSPYAQPPYAQPPQQGQAPYGGQPGYPPAPQGQPGYPPPQQTGQQQGQQPYPPQGYPQQGQFPPGGQPGGQWGPGPGGPQQQWPQASAPYGRQTRKGGNQIIFLAGGGIALVAIIGVVLAVILGGGDNQGDNKNAGPGPLPTNKPTTAAKDADQGIDAGYGVYVNPATGFIRKTDSQKGVYLVKQGEATFWLQVVQGKPGESGASAMPRLIDSQKKTMTASTFKAGEVKQEKPPAGQDATVTNYTSQSWSGSVTSQSGTTELSGFIAIVDTKDGRISAIQVVVRKDLESKLFPDIQAMTQSVVKSQ
jgi:hypothetical protein